MTRQADCDHSDSAPRQWPEQSISLPWCDACNRSRFARECPECGAQLSLSPFYSASSVVEIEERAWWLGRAGRDLSDKQYVDPSCTEKEAINVVEERFR